MPEPRPLLDLPIWEGCEVPAGYVLRLDADLDPQVPLLVLTYADYPLSSARCVAIATDIETPEDISALSSYILPQAIQTLDAAAAMDRGAGIN